MEAKDGKVAVEKTIIALTAHTHKEDIEHFLRSGLNEVVTKPFQEEDIHSVICKYSCNFISTAK